MSDEKVSIANLIDAVDSLVQEWNQFRRQRNMECAEMTVAITVLPEKTPAEGESRG